MNYTLGSLFDGSGGFPLAGSLCGITPVWASEVEPYPITVTRSRFPDMKHMGDISKINGAEIEPVDLVTFGSPCQDLSVAGKRAGLKHTENGDEETTRSGLFMEAVRIIKEMRRATNGKYPRFAVWENVPGSFSSNQGEDFRVVLEELIKIVEPSAVMPAVPKGGWPYADHYCGDGWSLAYRVLDAQFWGVPQRRRRIYLVLDLGGQRAGQILFERKGLRGYFTKGRAPWKRLATRAEGGAGTADRKENCLTPWDVQSRRIFTEDGVWPALYGGEGGGHGYVCRSEDSVVAFTQNQRDEVRDLGDKAGALQAQTGMKQQTFIVDSIGGQSERAWEGEVAPTLKATHYKMPPCVPQAAGFCTEHSAKSGGVGYQEETAPTLRAGTKPAVVYDARGNGDGQTVPTLTGDHENRVTDYTAVAVELVVYNGENITSPTNAANPQPGDPCHTLGRDSRNYVCIPIHDQATRFGGKRGDKQDGKGNGLGVGNEGEPMNTLTSADRHAVCYAERVYCMAHGQANAEICVDKCPCLNCNHEQPIVCGTFQNTGIGWWNESDIADTLRTPCSGDSTKANLVAAVDCRNLRETGEVFGTLQAKPNGGQSLNYSRAVRIRYIVRRLTPTECARLQGFPDAHGHPDHKEDFTDEEYAFWTEVRCTHAVVNGKEPKTYSRAQMVKWYNGLHTDSSEYKMWGNGIALPCALYVMQGITDALERTNEKHHAS